MQRTLSLPRAPRLPALRPFARLRAWQAIARQRRTLRHLDDAALADIGLNRTAAQAEADRPFWDAPGHWYE